MESGVILAFLPVSTVSFTVASALIDFLASSTKCTLYVYSLDLAAAAEVTVFPTVAFPDLSFHVDFAVDTVPDVGFLTDVVDLTPEPFSFFEDSTNSTVSFSVASCLTASFF